MRRDAGLLGQHVDEAVHLAIQGDRFGQVAAHGPQGAAEVLGAYAGDLADEPVAQQAGDLANEQMVLAADPQAEDRVVTFLEFLEHDRDVGRIVLQIAVQGYDDVARGPVDAGLQGGRLAEVAAQADYLDQRVALRQFFQDLERAVAAAVVHEDDFIKQAQRVDGSVEPLMQLADVLPFVLDRNHHREIHKSPRARAHGPASGPAFRVSGNGQTNRRRRPAS